MTGRPVGALTFLTNPRIWPLFLGFLRSGAESSAVKLESSYVENPSALRNAKWTVANIDASFWDVD